jgi:SAM-dependent methyltransferase
MTREVQLVRPDPTVHPVGRDHSGVAAQQQFELLVRCGLQPSSRFMEIGFDISPAAIKWLDANYAPALPNFKFDLVEVQNARYHPKAADAAAGARFPYGDDSFDFACSFSVFTHMRLPEIEHYLRELCRVLEPGGRGVMTFFAISSEDEVPALREPFVPLGGGVWTTHPELPERAIAFDASLIADAVAAAGLEPVDHFDGAWHAWTTGAHLHKDVYVLSPS